MNIIYSVIIPAYNAERTLKRCLESLLNQRREDVQIILISDGSTDGTDEIARSFSDRVQFVHQPHAGVSAARNLGLTLAKGEYITFVDSDDYVTADYFAALDREPDCHLLVFGLHTPLLGALKRGGREKRLGLLLRTRKITSPCNKRIRRSLIEENRLRFTEGLQVGEDFCFCFACTLAAETIGVSGACIYYADISDDNSLSRRYRPQLAEDLCQGFACAAQPGRYLAALDYLFARSVFTCIAEEFKAKDLRYFRDRVEIQRLCDQFRQPIGPCRGIVHRVLRLVLKLRADFLIYCIAWLGKGRRFPKCRKRKC